MPGDQTQTFVSSPGQSLTTQVGILFPLSLAGVCACSADLQRWNEVEKRGNWQLELSRCVCLMMLRVDFAHIRSAVPAQAHECTASELALDTAPPATDSMGLINLLYKPAEGPMSSFSLGTLTVFECFYFISTFYFISF